MSSSAVWDDADPLLRDTGKATKLLHIKALGRAPSTLQSPHHIQNQDLCLLDFSISGCLWTQECTQLPCRSGSSCRRSARATLLTGSLVSPTYSLAQAESRGHRSQSHWEEEAEIHPLLGAPWCWAEVATLPAMSSRLTSHPRQEPSKWSSSYCLRGS